MIDSQPTNRFWWCPFPLLHDVEERLRSERKQRWSRPISDSPDDCVLIVPQPTDVLVAWSSRPNLAVLSMDLLRSGYRSLSEAHKKHHRPLRLDLVNTESATPVVEELVARLNRENPDVLRDAYNLRGEAPHSGKQSEDPVAIWCRDQQARVATLAQHRQLLSQHRQHQRSSRRLITQLLLEQSSHKSSEQLKAKQPQPPRQQDQSADTSPA